MRLGQSNWQDKIHSSSFDNEAFPKMSSKMMKHAASSSWMKALDLDLRRCRERCFSALKQTGSKGSEGRMLPAAKAFLDTALSLDAIRSVPVPMNRRRTRRSSFPFLVVRSFSAWKSFSRNLKMRNAALST